ncbi:MAG: T9SS type A sorting domain-containing protein, partial [Syntrophothermus sp.]
LRNPWKFSFDRTTGDLWIGDVGQGQREEVDLEPYGTPGGRNYGWRCYEGSLPYQTDGCQSQNTYTFPVYEYAHDTSPCWAITGGYRYRGTLNPKMYGKYFFADYCKDIIGSLSDSSGTWSARTEGVFAGNNFSSFGEDNNGEIYIAGLSSGRIFRIADSAASGIAEQQADLLRVYPDPFEDHLIVEQKNPSGKMGLIIFDLRGKSIHTSALSGTRTSLDLQFLPAGIYFIQGKNDQFIFTRKIIKKSK